VTLLLKEQGLSVAGPFGCRCPSSRSMTPFSLPARRTERADFLHSALGPDITFAHGRRCGKSGWRRLPSSSGIYCVSGSAQESLPHANAASSSVVAPASA
jgi:hypothetical protein